MKWFKVDAAVYNVDWAYDIIPYESSNTFDIRFKADLHEMLAFYNIRRSDATFQNPYNEAKDVVAQAMVQIKEMVENSFLDNEITINTSAFPDIWLIISDIKDVGVFNRATREIQRMLKSFKAIVDPKVKKIAKELVASKEALMKWHKQAAGGKVPTEVLREYISYLIENEIKEGRTPDRKEVEEWILNDIEAYVDIESIIKELSEQEN